MTASRSAWSAGGGGACDQACQQRCTTRQGSSQLCTDRRARGHDGVTDGGGEELVGTPSEVADGWRTAGAPFFPSRLLGEGEGSPDGQQRSTIRAVPAVGGALGPPAEAEGTADQRPMAAMQSSNRNQRREKWTASTVRCNEVNLL